MIYYYTRYNVGWKDISSGVVNSCNEIMISRFEMLKENPSITMFLRIRDVNCLPGLYYE